MLVHRCCSFVHRQSSSAIAHAMAIIGSYEGWAWKSCHMGRSTLYPRYEQRTRETHHPNTIKHAPELDRPKNTKPTQSQSNTMPNTIRIHTILPTPRAIITRYIQVQYPPTISHSQSHPSISRSISIPPTAPHPPPNHHPRHPIILIHHNPHPAMHCEIQKERHLHRCIHTMDLLL